MKNLGTHLIILLILGNLNLCFAQNSYSWIEPDGNKVYGTNPPQNARNIKNLKTRELSKYSSKKLLDKISARASLKSSPELKLNEDISFLPILEDPTIKLNPKNILSKEKFKNKIKKIEKVTNIKSREPSLENSKLVVILDEKNSKIINNCKVDVTNTGGKIANEITIAFEFRDGTLIAATGPSRLEVGETRTYKMTLDLLPFKLNFALSRKKPEKDFKIRVSYN